MVNYHGNRTKHFIKGGLVVSRKRKFLISFLVLMLIFLLSTQMAYAGSNVTLRAESRGTLVTQLQKDLKSLGFMDVEPTGYFGKITEAAVKEFQVKTGLHVDGIAGKQTLGKLDSLLNRESTAYRGTSESKGQSIVNYARKFLGTKYRWGGTTTKGFDCSGFTQYVYKKSGISLSRVSRNQAKNGTYIKKANLRIGDLVFFDTNGGKNRINHVGIYIGGGKFIHSSSNHKGVVISNIDSGFYSKTYMTARRVLK